MPKVNGKEYPYTAEGMAAAKKAVEKMKDKKKTKPQGGTTGKAKPGAPYGGRGEYDIAKDMMKKRREKIKDNSKSSSSSAKKSLPKPPAMNKAIPGNKGGGAGAMLGSAAKKFVMAMPPVQAAKLAAKAGKAVGNAINPAPTRQMKRMPGALGDLRKMNEMPARPKATPLPRKVTPAPLNQLRKMNEMPSRQPKKLLPKKSGR
jgi:hypothetical protein